MILKDKTLAASISFSIFFILFGAFVLAPMVYDMSSVGLMIGGKDKEISAMDSRIEKAKSYRVYFALNERKFGKLDEMLVNGNMPLDFINFLEGAAKDCGVAAGISPSVPMKASKDYWPSINFEISLSGSFSSVLKYVKKMESGPYLIEIHNLNIKKEEMESKPGEISPQNVRAGIFLKVYAKN